MNMFLQNTHGDGRRLLLSDAALLHDRELPLPGRRAGDETMGGLWCSSLGVHSQLAIGFQ